MTLSNIVATSIIFNSSIKRYPIKFYFSRGLQIVIIGAIVSFFGKPLGS
ncbi:hypothetical protein [Algoriphagus boritolerans]